MPIGEYSLIDEIDAIAEHDAGPAVIIIHDCEVPGKISIRPGIPMDTFALNL